VNPAKPFDILRELGKFGAKHRLSLRDPGFKEALHVRDGIDLALSDPTLMHGHRAEAMFEALVVSLGEYQLLKAEDSGRVFPSAMEFGPPEAA
jgi:hypothetical protein